MKKFLCALLASLMLISVAACDKSDNDSQNDDSQTSSESSTVIETEATEVTTESTAKVETTVTEAETTVTEEETTTTEDETTVTEVETTVSEEETTVTEVETTVTVEETTVTETETTATETETTVTEEETTVTEEETTIMEVETTVTETETTKIETEPTETEEETTVTETEPETTEIETTETTETETTEEETTDTEVETEEDKAFPADGATIVLANDEVYEWSDNYRFTKTDSSPYYRHEDIYYPIPVIFTWEEVADADYYRVYISTSEDFADSESFLINDNSLSVDHLFVGTKYYWTVIATQVVDGAEVNSYAVAPRSFNTASSPRCFRIEGVSNTRDIGGLDAKDGYRIKQGMIYRGGKLENITDAGKDYFLNYIGITTDLDLRTPGEGGAGAGSPLGSDINYINFNGRYYTGSMGITTEEGKAVFAEEIRVFANPDNYPIYVHCSLGRDRTGTLIFVIEALLGVSRMDLYMDYELSIFSVTGTLDNASIDAIRNNIVSTYTYIHSNYSGSTFAEKTENYLLDIGITPEEIQTIRDLLLEEVK